MEYFSLFNLVMAVSIAAIIIVISVVKNPVIKAIIYGLPIPITLALIATQKTVDGSHVGGLFLLTGFLWMMYFLKRKSINIFLADVISAVLYVFLGYILVVVLKVQDHFLVSCLMYAIFWLGMISLVKGSGAVAYRKKKVINVYTKGIMVTGIALLLLSVKNLLKGVIVTFPFSGVFAVVEMQEDLEILAKEFTKNSLAILIFFLVIHATFPVVGLFMAIVAGWAVYWVSLFMIRKLVK